MGLSAQSNSYTLNGETAPATQPQKFGVGVLPADSVKLGGLSFSPDGNELVYVVREKGMFYMQKQDGKWTAPSLIAASQQFKTHVMYPKFSPDGSFISFVDGNSKEFGFGDIYRINRLEDGSWSDRIVKFPAPINSAARDAGHSFTSDGTLYFSSGRADDTWSGNILQASPNNAGSYDISVLEELSIFSIETDEECLYVAPQGEYLITDSWRSVNGHKIDLYITYKRSNGQWSEIKALNANINTEGLEHIPFVSSDHQYLFFVRDDHFYWVSTKEIFTPYQNLKIPDFYEKVDKEISLKFSAETFMDFNGTITDYDLSILGQDSLPDWMSFNPAALALKGIAKEAETLCCVLLATDNDGNQSQAEFKIIIAE